MVEKIVSRFFHSGYKIKIKSKQGSGTALSPPSGRVEVRVPDPIGGL